MPVGTEVPLEAPVLRWALEDAGVSATDVATRLDVDQSIVNGWLEGVSLPKLTQFRALARMIGRPESFFFLPAPPKSTPASLQFRTFASAEAAPGPKTISAIRLAQRIQTTATWTRKKIGDEPMQLPKVGAGIEESARTLRDWLGWDISDEHRDGATDPSIARSFRSLLQQNGIVALHFTMDEEVTRGFSLHDSWAPLIAINTRDHYRARIFSYAHELVHLSLGNDSVCSTVVNRGTERYCNQVAAALLMPSANMTHLILRRFGGQQVSTLAHVVTVRNHFHVSLRAAAIRLEHLGLGQPGLFDRVNSEAEYTKKGGRYSEENKRDRPRMRLDQYGYRFVEDLVEAEDKGALKHAQLLSLLRLSGNEFTKLRSLLDAGLNE